MTAQDSKGDWPTNRTYNRVHYHTYEQVLFFCQYAPAEAVSCLPIWPILLLIRRAEVCPLACTVVKIYQNTPLRGRIALHHCELFPDDESCRLFITVLLLSIPQQAVRADGMHPSQETGAARELRTDDQNIAQRTSNIGICYFKKYLKTTCYCPKDKLTEKAQVRDDRRPF